MLKFLKYYSRKEIQKALVEQAKDKEIGVRYRETFGKRPDTLQFDTDVFEFARKGATSFHISEETWNDPMGLTTGITKKQLDEQRKGWDLILDIDCPYWDYSKLTAYLLVEALKFHGIKKISTKFSVIGETPVFCEINKIRQLLSIQEAISKFKEGSNVKILSLNKDFSVTFNKIYDSLEHKTSLFELHHSNINKPIILSPDHSVYIFSEDNIRAKKTKDLKVGDYVISFKESKLNFNKNLEVPIDYKLNGIKFKENIKITKDLMRLIGYYLAEGHLLEKYRSEIGFSFNIKEKEYINDVANLISELNGTNAYFNKYHNYLKDKEQRKKNTFLAKKYGGCLLHKFKNGYIPIIKQEKARVINKEKVNTTQILFCSSKWNRFFKKYCERGSHNKKVPDFVFKLPKEYFMELLKGYLRGDGHTGKYNVKAKSVSKKLITSLTWLCKLHGISCGYSEQQEKEHKLPNGTLFKGSYTYCITIPRSEFPNNPEFFRKSSKFGSKPDDYLIPLFPLRKVYAQCKPKCFVKHRVEQMMLRKGAVNRGLIKKIINWFVKYKSKPFDKDSERILKFYEKILKSNLSFFRIKKIEKLNDKRKVYDVSVDKSENFFGGNIPILLHNSGNKGFHIGIPFEAFPDEVSNKKTKDLYPDGLRTIAAYLQEMVRPMLTKKILEKETIRDIVKRTGKAEIELIKDEEFDPFTIIDIDTILISSRHLYRAAYSLHEKSGLVSLPIEADKIMEFEKEMAEPEKVEPKLKFLERELKEKEARELIIQAFDWHSKQTLREKLNEEPSETKTPTNYEPTTIPINEDKFPDCIKKILAGNMEDGRKRALFILLRFLRNVGWSVEAIDNKIKEWNKTHQEPINESYIVTQLMWHKRQKNLILPPNCTNNNYYQDLQLCSGNNVCMRYKNPVNFTKTQFKIESIKKKTKKSRSSKPQAC
ncbi:MAG: hypothetical protein V1914_01205 [archaeon]